MKKLMIAAAAAAMVGGAFAAGLCDDEPASAAECAVYNVKFTLKTLDAKLVKVKGSSAICGDSTDDQNCVYLDNATRKIDGIIWDCDAGCGTLNTEAMKVALWETKSKMGIGELLAFDEDDGYTANDLPFSLINRYGKKAEKVQAIWELGGGTNDMSSAGLLLNDKAMYEAGEDLGEVSLVAAGFGTFNAKQGIVKSISGNAVGMFTAPLTQKYANCEGPFVADLCTEFSNWCSDGDAADVLAASGTWSVKYNASLSKGKKRLGQIVPAYAQAERESIPVEP